MICPKDGCGRSMQKYDSTLTVEKYVCPVHTDTKLEFDTTTGKVAKVAGVVGVIGGVALTLLKLFGGGRGDNKS